MLVRGLLLPVEKVAATHDALTDLVVVARHDELLSVRQET